MITIVANHVPTKNTNNVWAVSIEGQEDSIQYCKSPRSAMKYMFLLKARTSGAKIADESLKALSKAHAEYKAEEAKKHPEQAAMAEKVQELAASIAEAHDINRILAEKPKRKTKSAEVPAEKPSPKKRGRKPKAEKAA